MQPGLSIEVLAREAQIRERRKGLLLGLTEGPQHHIPSEVLVRIGRLLRRV